MMQAYRTENSYRSAARLSPAELRAAMASGEILQATALAFDTRRQLRFELGGVKAVMPFVQCADGAETGSVRDIAVLTRVGRPTCFVIEGLDTDEDGAPCYRLSRAEAQRLCKAEYLDTLSPGDILPCTVTHIEPFGAFCDVGCGISALLPIDCMSVSRISSPAELRAAMASGEILQATALAFDTRRQLRFELGGVKAVMPFAQCADGAEAGTVRDIAVLTRVGRPTCFVIEGLDTDEDGTPCYRLSRAEAQRLCKAEYLDTLSPGDILPCTVTHIEPFGAFCDVGCGISALLPIDCMSVSRISSPADRVSVGQQILCAIKNRDAQGRFVLTIRELLGTWAENAARFTVGETVVGIVRSVEEYGTFVEIAPNLAGLAESCSGLAPGQAVSVYIKNILPEKMKIKLVIVNHALNQPHRFELRYFITEGHLDRWVYSTPECPKRIETDFAVAACNPG